MKSSLFRSTLHCLMLSILLGPSLVGYGAERRTRTKIGQPFTPESLFSYGIFNASICQAESLKGRESWTNHYNIWLNYGYQEKSSWKQGGTLAIEKLTQSKKARSETYRASQVYYNPDHVSHTIDAEMICSLDPIPRLLSWSTDTKFTGTDRTQYADVAPAFTERVRVTGSQFHVQIGDRSFVRQGCKEPTCDWLVFAGVQCLLQDKAARRKPLSFSMLEGLRNLRAEQTLVYCGLQMHQLGDTQVRLHAFEQTGQGILPYQYYLNEAGRLVLVITGYRMVVLKP